MNWKTSWNGDNKSRSSWLLIYPLLKWFKFLMEENVQISLKKCFYFKSEWALGIHLWEICQIFSTTGNFFFYCLLSCTSGTPGADSQGRVYCLENLRERDGMVCLQSWLQPPWTPMGSAWTWSFNTTTWADLWQMLVEMLSHSSMWPRLVSSIKRRCQSTTTNNNNECDL